MKFQNFPQKFFQNIIVARSIFSRQYAVHRPLERTYGFLPNQFQDFYFSEGNVMGFWFEKIDYENECALLDKIKISTRINRIFVRRQNGWK